MNTVNMQTQPVFAEGTFLMTCSENLMELVGKVQEIFLMIWNAITCGFFKPTEPLNPERIVPVPQNIVDAPVVDRSIVRPDPQPPHEEQALNQLPPEENADLERQEVEPRQEEQLEEDMRIQREQAAEQQRLDEAALELRRAEDERLVQELQVAREAQQQEREAINRNLELFAL